MIRLLHRAGYDFVCPTPLTHERVLARPDRRTARTLRDVFGWSLPFEGGFLPTPILDALQGAGGVRRAGYCWKAGLRASSLDGDLFLHSAYPTREKDAVFFGPDTYRFAGFLKQELAGKPRPARAVEIGTGSGAGAVQVARLAAPSRLIVTDVNPEALALADANLAAAGVSAELRLCDGLDALDGPFDLVVANPPYMVDSGDRAYRNGGDMRGARLSLDWARASAERLAPGGRMLLYTGSAIVDGEDELKSALAASLDWRRYSLAYRELDPDVFGEELGHDAYRDVERIAAVGVVIERTA